jgi:hypothetical protein
VFQTTDFIMRYLSITSAALLLVIFTILEQVNAFFSSSIQRLSLSRSIDRNSIDSSRQINRNQQSCNVLSALPKLLPDPMPNSIGNFFENKTDGMSFIQCYMLSVAVVDGQQYGVGFPVDMPVMLTYFEGNELKPVQPEYPDYDHLMNHVAVQLDSNEFQLYRTPVVLTLQGEFEDEELNEIIPGQKMGNDKKGGDNEDDYEDDDDFLEDDDEDEGEEISVADVIALEGIDDEDDDEMYDDDDEDEDDDEDDDDEEEGEEGENKNMDSFWSASPVGKIDEKYAKIPDYTIVRPEKPDISDIPMDAFVTDEDTKSLKKAHRRADRIIEYAADVSLIASFHYKKKNFHLVKLLEPIFIIGKRIDDIKGYYFTLLDEKESLEITPVLETLLAKRSTSGLAPTPQKKNTSKDKGFGRAGRGAAVAAVEAKAAVQEVVDEVDVDGRGEQQNSRSVSAGPAARGRGSPPPVSADRPRRSRRRWTNRGGAEEGEEK